MTLDEYPDWINEHELDDPYELKLAQIIYHLSAISANEVLLTRLTDDVSETRSRSAYKTWAILRNISYFESFQLDFALTKLREFMYEELGSEINRSLLEVKLISEINRSLR